MEHFDEVVQSLTRDFHNFQNGARPPLSRSSHCVAAGRSQPLRFRLAHAVRQERQRFSKPAQVHLAHRQADPQLLIPGEMRQPFGQDLHGLRIAAGFLIQDAEPETGPRVGMVAERPAVECFGQRGLSGYGFDAGRSRPGRRSWPAAKRSRRAADGIPGRRPGRGPPQTRADPGRKLPGGSGRTRGSDRRRASGRSRST